MQVPGRPAVFWHAGSRAQQPSRCVALRQAHKRAAAAAPVSPLRRGVGTGPAAASRGKELGRRVGFRRPVSSRGPAAPPGVGQQHPCGSVQGSGEPAGPPPPRASADAAPLEIGAGGCPPRQQLPLPHPWQPSYPQGDGDRVKGRPCGMASPPVWSRTAAGGSGTGSCRTPTRPRWLGAALLPAVAGRRRRSSRGAAGSRQPLESCKRLPGAGGRWGQRVPRAAGSRSAPLGTAERAPGQPASPHLTAAVPGDRQCYIASCLRFVGGREAQESVLIESKEMREEPSCNAAPRRVCICF